MEITEKPNKNNKNNKNVLISTNKSFIFIKKKGKGLFINTLIK